MSNLVFTLVNTGTARASYSVAVQGVAVDGVDVLISKKELSSLEATHTIAANCGATDEKINSLLSDKILEINSGSILLDYLESNEISVATFISEAMSFISSASKKKPGSEEKKDKIPAIVRNFAKKNLARIACKMATPNVDGVTDEMLASGRTAMLAFIEEVVNTNEADFLELMKEVASNGVDSKGVIRFRNTGDEASE